MKLLVFSDLHRNTQAAVSLVQRAETADVLVGAGDFASVRRGISDTIDVLRDVDKPVVLVPGNNETLEELQQACHGWSGAHVLHGTSVTIGGVPFFGLGAGVPVTPFGDWSFDLTEGAAAELLSACPDNAVLVSHSPPKGCVDVSSRGLSLGSVAVLEAIQEKRPRLVVCGHIHESAGKTAAVGASTIINAGPGGIDWDV